METDFKLKENKLIKIPVHFALCYGVYFFSKDEAGKPQCKRSSIPELEKQKIEVLMPNSKGLFERCLGELKFYCSHIISNRVSQEFIFVYEEE